mgnify:CR=1 FL=1
METETLEQVSEGLIKIINYDVEYLDCDEWEEGGTFISYDGFVHRLGKYLHSLDGEFDEEGFISKCYKGLI